MLFRSELIENLITKVESTQSLVQSFVKVLESFNKFPAGRFDELISQLQGVNGELDKAKDFLQQLHDTTVNGGEPNLTVLNNIKTLLSSVSSTASAIYNRFDSAIVPSLNNVIDQAYSTATNVLQVLKEAETKLPDVASLLNTA